MVGRHIFMAPMLKRLLVHPTLAVLLLGTLHTPLISQAAPATTPTVSAATYRAQLQQADTTLSRMKHSARRPLSGVLQGLSKAQIVQRADGARMTAGADEWKRRASDLGAGNPTRDEVRAVQQIVRLRLRALDEWRNPSIDHPGGGYYQNQDAQSIMRQLESTGQIRTGPTRAQQIMADVMKAIKRFFERLFGWIGRLLPTPAASASTPNINPRLVWALFLTTFLALASVILFFAWRALSGRYRRIEARREVRFLEGEDADLLRLPPDELKERAAQWAKEGNFPEALRHLYISLLLRLDARGVWHYDTRRTNWEHIAGLRQNASRMGLVQPLSDLTRRFDRVRYGNARCTGDDWTRFAHDVETVENNLSESNTTTMPASTAGAHS